ncbi:MAG: pyruvate, phosphate dikinase [Magnetococcales bacterium]|nr:pyruvate, phosphate dikinase [Magnetococcales bacterium]
MSKKNVYIFGDGKADGDATLRNLLGGKGANLAEMSRLGLPVPAGFTITTEVCAHFSGHGGEYPKGLSKEVDEAIKKVEKVMGARFGDAANPLLLSVRSGARASMPGMMDTVLNLGLNEETAAGLVKQTGNGRFVYDSFRRFVQMYSDVVLGVDHSGFEALLNRKKAATGKTLDTEMSEEDWRDLVGQFKERVLLETGKAFPEDPREQLWGAIGAVFNSWMNQRAITYRRLNDIPEEWGTACNVQSMVFGNMGENSATGVAFTRDPATGERRFYGEFLINAQGEDVVAGIRTPQQITLVGKERQGSDLPSMEEVMPKLYKELCDIYAKLEAHYRDMQDMEFTVQQGKLWILQTRTGKRTTRAALKIAVDMVREGLIKKRDAVKRVDPKTLDRLFHPMLDPKGKRTALAKGLAASPGAASGRVVFSADKAEELSKQGEDVILIRDETSPEDIHGMHAARGIVTARGGMTSHAAIVAVGMGRPCVAGCSALRIDEKAETFQVKDTVVKEGDWITMDGSTGEIFLDKMETFPSEIFQVLVEGTRKPEDSEVYQDFAALMGWADDLRRLRVRTNADTPTDAMLARRFGAEGIGLCRTEHMFFEAERIISVRKMILAHTIEERRAALAEILPMQRSDFEGIFREMRDLPVTIRLLDPPLHEFIPHDAKGQSEVAKALKVTVKAVKDRVEALKEFNPMLGHRGCRLGITYPEIYEMQVQAIMEAACNLITREGFSITPEIMIPLVGNVKELSFLRDRCVVVADEVVAKAGVKVKYLIGTMIELPRAAVTADRIARVAEFFSFGTNDLTQTTMGLSRDDAGNFLGRYLELGLMEKDPFVSLDQEGVGELVRMGVEKGRSTRADLKVGICGEHGGDPASIHFCERVGLDYVSCSPFRVAIARLAAAQAALAAKGL